LLHGVEIAIELDPARTDDAVSDDFDLVFIHQRLARQLIVEHGHLPGRL